MATKVKTRSMDRISNLPDTVLCHILSFLPTIQAVRNSIPSTRWKCLFASLTNLDFVYSSSTEKGNENDKPVRNISTFINFVDRVLFLLNIAPCVDRFCLRCKNAIDSSLVNSWISAALWRNVQELNLRVSVKESNRLPRDLFTCKTLVKLKLGIKFQLIIPAKVCLPSLKVLRLDSIVFSDDDSIERLFPSCLVLEDLVKARCEWKNVRNFNISSHALKRLTIRNPFNEFCVYKVVVDAPNLVYLAYTDYVVEGYSLTNLYSLVEAHIDFELGSMQNGYSGKYSDVVTGFFRGISNVQSLYLSKSSMEAILLCRYPPPVFHNLTHLDISADEHTLVQGLPDLLERCSNLETLVFEALLPSEYNEDSPYHWNPPEYVPYCLLFHLKDIKIFCFEGRELELELVKYYLKNAIVLKKLMIHTFANEKEQLKITKELLMLPRSCQVVIF